MSVETALVRIAEIQRAFTPAAPRPPAGAGFQAVLGAQTAAVAPTTMGLPATAAGWTAGGAQGGAGALQAAQAEVGVTEQPPGSNDGPRIAEYRQATAGSGVGPWCAYFVSWAARQAGTPLGEQGQGFGAVSAVWDWASRTGRAVPAGSTPQPGDLIVWGGRHIGIVESVGADGSINTVEGNSSDAVSRRTYGADGGGATGYVRLS
jgi:CHAP domain